LGLPKVGILDGVGVDDTAISKNNLPVLDHVARKTMRIAMEGILESC
jgi:hypothetical protein